MKLGNLDLGKRLLVAPMAEVTDSAFRRIAKDYGAGLTFTQMVSAEGVIKNNFDTLRYLVFNRKEKPIGVQVLGSDPEILAGAVRDLINYRPDVIDLNSGCPVEKVCKHNMGAKLLDDPVRLGKIVKSMVQASSDIPVSVKLRLGRNKKNINILENAKVCEDNGASYIIIHARTKEDKYSSEPKWEVIGEVKNALKIPVVLNGSLFEPAEIVDAMKLTGADSAMVARGALGNPFIFRRYNQIVETGRDPGLPEPSEVKSVCLKHLDYYLEEFQESVAISKIKKHTLWYFREFRGMPFLTERIFSVKTKEGLEELLEQHISNLDNGKYEIDTTGIIKQKFFDKVVFWNEE